MNYAGPFLLSFIEEKFMNTTFGSTHNGIQINTDQRKGLGCITSILDNYQKHLAHMIASHSKVMQVRFDLHYPNDGTIVPNRQHIYNFNYNLKRKLQRETIIGGHRVDPQILWTEEINSSTAPHYHFLLLANGNAKNNYKELLKNTVNPLWKNTINSDNDGLVDYCDKNGPNGLMITRSSPDVLTQINRCSYQASYLAKIKTKDARGKGCWLMGGSRVPSAVVPLQLPRLALF